MNLFATEWQDSSPLHNQHHHAIAHHHHNHHHPSISSSASLSDTYGLASSSSTPSSSTPTTHISSHNVYSPPANVKQENEVDYNRPSRSSTGSLTSSNSDQYINNATGSNGGVTNNQPLRNGQMQNYTTMNAAGNSQGLGQQYQQQSYSSGGGSTTGSGLAMSPSSTAQVKATTSASSDGMISLGLNTGNTVSNSNSNSSSSLRFIHPVVKEQPPLTAIPSWSNTANTNNNNSASSNNNVNMSRVVNSNSHHSNPSTGNTEASLSWQQQGQGGGGGAGSHATTQYQQHQPQQLPQIQQQQQSNHIQYATVNGSGNNHLTPNASPMSAQSHLSSGSSPYPPPLSGSSATSMFPNNGAAMGYAHSNHSHSSLGQTMLPTPQSQFNSSGSQYRQLNGTSSNATPSYASQPNRPRALSSTTNRTTTISPGYAQSQGEAPATGMGYSSLSKGGSSVNPGLGISSNQLAPAIDIKAPTPRVTHHSKQESDYWKDLPGETSAMNSGSVLPQPATMALHRSASAGDFDPYLKHSQQYQQHQQQSYSYYQQFQSQPPYQNNYNQRGGASDNRNTSAMASHQSRNPSSDGGQASAQPQRRDSVQNLVTHTGNDQTMQGNNKDNSGQGNMEGIACGVDDATMAGSDDRQYTSPKTNRPALSVFTDDSTLASGWGPSGTDSKDVSRSSTSTNQPELTFSGVPSSHAGSSNSTTSHTSAGTTPYRDGNSANGVNNSLRPDAAAGMNPDGHAKREFYDYRGTTASPLGGASPDSRRNSPLLQHSPYSDGHSAFGHTSARAHGSLPHPAPHHLLPTLVASAGAYAPPSGYVYDSFHSTSVHSSNSSTPELSRQRSTGSFKSPASDHSQALGAYAMQSRPVLSHDHTIPDLSAFHLRDRGTTLDTWARLPARPEADDEANALLK